MSAEWPWNHRVRWTEIAPAGESIRIGTDETTRARIADELGVEGIGYLGADVAISHWLDGLEVRGLLSARVNRVCGVSLELFDELVDEPVVLRFVPQGSPNAAPPAEGDVELDLEAEDPPDCVAGDAVDLGSYLTEQLALALSPFPKKPGVEFEPPAGLGSISPFAVLARLKPTAPEEGD